MEIVNSQIPHIYRNRFLRDTGGGAIISSSGSSSGGGGGGGGTPFEPHYLWGQYFDDTQDITGSMTVDGSVTAQSLHSPRGYLDKITGESLGYQSGYIGKLDTDSITNKADIITENLNVKNNAWITNLNSENITTDFLTVNKQAHFFELVIDKIKSVGGTLIMTAANAVIDYVKAFNSSNVEVSLNSNNIAYYKVYWNAEDKYTERILDNEFEQYDQAICMSFNNVHQGSNHDVSNKYYWRLVEAKYDQKYLNFSNGEEINTDEPDVAFKTSVNSVTISNPSITYNGSSVILNGWNGSAADVDDVDTGVIWDQSTGGASSPLYGIMHTENTSFGIELTPVANTLLAQTVPSVFSLTCTSARLNIVIYYTDNTSEVFDAPSTATTSYSLNLTTTAPISMVTISNADEVNWHLTNSIRLSNTDCDRPSNHSGDSFYANKYDNPTAGDNIVQLGYRWQGSNDTNQKSRGNAIIIAAYKTPDAGTGPQGIDLYNRYPIVPPSYAQYEYIGTDASHRYELAYYRKTYMDANSSIFRGKFVATDGESIEDKIESGEADLFQLFQAYAHDDGHGRPDSTSWQKAPVTGTWEWWGTRSEPITIQSGETRDEAIARVEATLVFGDYSWTELPSSPGQQGPQGSAGPQGDSGQTGPQGDSGAQGPAGAQGDEGQQGPQGSAGPQGNSGQTGPQGDSGAQGPAGAQGEDGEDAVVYKLIDWGSQAYYSIALDASNSVVSTIAFRLKFRVAKVIGTDTTFLTGQDLQFWADDTMQIVGLWPYAKFSKTTTSTSVVYKWYKFSFASQADYNDGICTLEWIPDWTETEIKNATLNNPSISVGLIPSSANDLSEDAAVVEDMKDHAEVPVIMAANAQWQVNGDIKGLVTGQQGINQNISSLTIGVQGIQTNVSSLQTQMDGFQAAGYVDQSTLTQTASQIKAEVVSTYNNADGLAYNIVVDLVSYVENGTTKYYDTTKFYPITVALPWQYTYYDDESESYKTVKGQKQRVIINRFLENSYGVPAYANHNSGFVMKLDFVTVACGWDQAWPYDTSKYRNGEPLFINKYEVDYTKPQAIPSPNPNNIPNIPANYIAGGIKQNHTHSHNPDGSTNSGFNDEIIYLRGGSKYNVSTSYKNTKVYVWKDGYTYNNANAYVIDDWRDLDVAVQDEMTRSEIVQTANNIQLNVYDTIYKQTGINIETGKITLDAENTVIDGNLNITNSNEGLQIYDGTTPKISILNRNIGTDPTAITDYKIVSYDYTILRNPGYNSFSFPTVFLQLGTFVSGTQVALSDFTWKLSAMISDDGHSYYAKDVIDTSSTYIEYTGPGNINSDQTAQGALTGLSNVSYTSSGSADQIVFNTIDGDVIDDAKTKYCLIRLKISGKVNYVSSSGVLVGKDGLSVQSTTGNIYTWLCSDSAIIRNGNSIFRVKNGKIQRNDQRFTSSGRANTEMGGTIFGDISSVMPVYTVNAQNYSANNNDCFIVVSTYLGSTSATRTITLPAPNAAPTGKIYYIKNISPNPCNVTTVTDGLMEPDGTSLSTSMSVSNKSMMFINDGSEYIMYYCA